MSVRDTSKEEYRKLLLHPNWQKKRLEILSRDGFECQECGSTEKTLHVHHLHYEKGRPPWAYPNTSLVTLCEDCHSDEHATRYDFERNLMTSLRLLGLRSSTIAYIDYALSGIGNLPRENQTELIYAWIDVLSWCELDNEARTEFIEFAKALKSKHIDSPCADDDGGA